MTHPTYVTVGRVGRVYGVHGFVTIHSFTEPQSQILSYQPWVLGDGNTWRNLKVAQVEETSKHTLVQFEGYHNPEQSRLLTGLWLAVPRDRLPAPAKGEYYWADLMGLQVYTTTDEPLGTIVDIFSTGAHPILVLQGDKERMIPFVTGDIITAVDLKHKRLTANWDPLF